MTDEIEVPTEEVPEETAEETAEAIEDGGYEALPAPDEPYPEPVVEVAPVEDVPITVPDLVPDLVAVSHVPETALDANGVRYMTGRMIHYNAAGEEVPAPAQEPVRVL